MNSHKPLTVEKMKFPLINPTSMPGNELERVSYKYNHVNSSVEFGFVHKTYYVLCF